MGAIGVIECRSTVSKIHIIFVVLVLQRVGGNLKKKFIFMYQLSTYFYIFSL